MTAFASVIWICSVLSCLPFCEQGFNKANCARVPCYTDFQYKIVWNGLVAHLYNNKGDMS